MQPWLAFRLLRRWEHSGWGELVFFSPKLFPGRHLILLLLVWREPGAEEGVGVGEGYDEEEKMNQAKEEEEPKQDVKQEDVKGGADTEEGK